MSDISKTPERANKPLRPKTTGLVSDIFGHVEALVNSLGKDRAVITIAWAVASLGSFAAGWQGTLCVQAVFGLIFFVFRKTGLIQD